MRGGNGGGGGSGGGGCKLCVPYFVCLFVRAFFGLIFVLSSLTICPPRSILLAHLPLGQGCCLHNPNTSVDLVYVFVLTYGSASLPAVLPDCRIYFLDS